MSVSLISEALCGCSGCEIALVDLGENLLKLLDGFDVLHMPMLMDHKHGGVEGGLSELPEADVGILTGALRNADDLRLAREVRSRVKTLVALGTCATHGGVPALANQFGNEQVLDRCYRTTETTDPAPTPSEEVSTLLDRVYALDEKIEVDVLVPGCPPHGDQLVDVLEGLLSGTAAEAVNRSVCDFCPARREGKGAVNQVRRFVRNPQIVTDRSLNSMRCLLEQGFICMGPVTRGGCGGKKGDAPRCVAVGVPCRGCYGPVRRGGNPMLDMMNALASNSVDIRTIPEKSLLLLFTGAHGRLIRRVARNR